MKTVIALAALGLALPMTAQEPTPRPSTSPKVAPAPVKLWRLDCGTVQVNDLDVFSDTRAYVGRRKTLTDSCYLIRHGDRYMLWDSGVPAVLLGVPTSPSGAISMTMGITIVDQLARIGVKPEQIELLGISHLHGDHTGQAASFPGAMLLIGAGDWAALTAKPSPPGVNAVPLAHWLRGHGKVDPVTRDRDVFGDGSVTMIDLPGHTAGHHGLLVRLRRGGAVLLSGDQFHFAENFTTNGVPSFNADRAATMASHHRFKKLAANLRARVIIQHEPADVAKLPAFPAGLE